MALFLISRTHIADTIFCLLDIRRIVGDDHSDQLAVISTTQTFLVLRWLVVTVGVLTGLRHRISPSWNPPWCGGRSSTKYKIHRLFEPGSGPIFP